MAVTTLDPITALIVVALGLGGLLIGLFLARRFGRFHGGNEPQRI